MLYLHAGRSHDARHDPMCADENSMLWIQAYVAHAQPPEGKVGITYMLQGDSVASNIDPM